MTNVAAHSRRARWAGALCAALAALAVVPMGSRAAIVNSSGAQVTYRAAPGEYNDVRMSVKGTESGARSLHVGHQNNTPLYYEDTECEEDLVLGGVSCPLAGSSFAIAADLGDHDDQLRIGDTLGLAASASVDGGPGNDAVVSSTTRVEFSGGEGDDRLASDGLARMNPPGAPVPGDVFRGGAGHDSSCLNDPGPRDDAMAIVLDGVANDGASGENDNIMPDVEEVCGGKQDDTIIGSAGPDELHGDNGDDTIEGGAGDDILHGGCGDDTVVGGRGADSLHDDPSSIHCAGGNDELNARDGERDTIYCGGGADTVFHDEVDVIGVLPNLCERNVIRLPKLEGNKLRASKRTLRVRIACPAGGAKCKGRLKVKAARKVKLGGKRRKYTLATGRYRVPAGKTKRVRAKLTNKGRKAVKRRLRVTVQLRTAAGTKINRTARLR